MRLYNAISCTPCVTTASEKQLQLKHMPEEVPAKGAEQKKWNEQFSWINDDSDGARSPDAARMTNGQQASSSGPRTTGEEQAEDACWARRHVKNTKVPSVPTLTKMFSFATNTTGDETPRFDNTTNHNEQTSNRPTNSFHFDIATVQTERGNGFYEEHVYCADRDWDEEKSASSLTTTPSMMLSESTLDILNDLSGFTVKTTTTKGSARNLATSELHADFDRFSIVHHCDLHEGGNISDVSKWHPRVMRRTNSQPSQDDKNINDATGARIDDVRPTSWKDSDMSSYPQAARVHAQPGLAGSSGKKLGVRDTGQESQAQPKALKEPATSSKSFDAGDDYIAARAQLKKATKSHGPVTVSAACDVFDVDEVARDAFSLFPTIGTCPSSDDVRREGASGEHRLSKKSVLGANASFPSFLDGRQEQNNYSGSRYPHTSNSFGEDRDPPPSEPHHSKSFDAYFDEKTSWVAFECKNEVRDRSSDALYAPQGVPKKKSEIISLDDVLQPGGTNRESVQPQSPHQVNNIENPLRRDTFKPWTVDLQELRNHFDSQKPSLLGPILEAKYAKAHQRRNTLRQITPSKPVQVASHAISGRKEQECTQRIRPARKDNEEASPQNIVSDNDIAEFNRSLSWEIQNFDDYDPPSPANDPADAELFVNLFHRCADELILDARLIRKAATEVMSSARFNAAMDSLSIMRTPLRRGKLGHSKVTAITAATLIKVKEEMESNGRKQCFLPNACDKIRRTNPSLLALREEMPTLFSRAIHIKWDVVQQDLDRLERRLDEFQKQAVLEITKRDNELLPVGFAGHKPALSVADEVELLQRTPAGRFAMEACVRMATVYDDIDKAEQSLEALASHLNGKDKHGSPKPMPPVHQTFDAVTWICTYMNDKSR